MSGHIEISARVANLRDQITWFMPLLEENYQESVKRFEKKRLKEGGLNLVSHRFVNAIILTKADIFPLTKTETPESIFEANAMLVWDINNAITRLPSESRKKKTAEKKRDALLKLYHDNGFTELNGFYKIPERPIVVEQKPQLLNQKKLSSKKQTGKKSKELRLTA